MWEPVHFGAGMTFWVSRASGVAFIDGLVNYMQSILYIRLC